MNQTIKQHFLSRCAIGVLTTVSASILSAQQPAPVFTTIGEQGGFIAMGPGGAVYIANSLGNGQIFSLTPPQAPGGPWTSSTLFVFTGQLDGGVPIALIATIGSDGKPLLYGATQLGGVSNLGTIFSLAPPAVAGTLWTETVLYSFTGGADASNPGALALDSNGILYGVTEGTGFINTPSTVFSLTPPAVAGEQWSEKVLATFAFSVQPEPPLNGVTIVHRPGGKTVLVGSTCCGGPSNAGSVYALTSPTGAGGTWAYQDLYGFSGGLDGLVPAGPITQGRNGVLYGTTAFGGVTTSGTVYSLTPPAAPGDSWSEDVLWSFGSDGNLQDTPVAGVVVGPNGELYGTTHERSGYGPGAIFALTPPAAGGASWTRKTLHVFDAQLENPTTPMILRGGVLSRSSGSDGTVFSLIP